MRFGDWGEKIFFLCRAFDQALPDLTQRREYRIWFGDWGEDYIFLGRAFDQALPDLTQRLEARMRFEIKKGVRPLFQKK